MGVYVGANKAITIHNFILDKSWMVAAHVRVNCFSYYFPSN